MPLPVPDSFLVLCFSLSFKSRQVEQGWATSYYGLAVALIHPFAVVRVAVDVNLSVNV